MKLLSNNVDQNDQIISLETFFKELLNNIDYSHSDFEIILSKFRPVTIKKGTLFCEVGKYCSKIGFLTKGLLLAYYENFQNEIEVSRHFDVPISIVVTDFDALLNSTPCVETIKAIEDSYMYCIFKQDLFALYEQIPIMNVIGRKLAEYGYIMAVRRMLSLQTLDTEQRFKLWYSINPSLFYRLSKKDLSTFLKMNRNLVTKYLKQI